MSQVNNLVVSSIRSMRTNYRGAYSRLPKPFDVPNDVWSLYIEVMTLEATDLERACKQVASSRRIDMLYLMDLLVSIDASMRQAVKDSKTEKLLVPDRALLFELIDSIPRAKSALNTLLFAGSISQLSDLSEYTREDLVKLKGLGHITVTEIEAFMSQYGLRLKPSRDLLKYPYVLKFSKIVNGRARHVATFGTSSDIARLQDAIFLSRTFAGKLDDHPDYCLEFFAGRTELPSLQLSQSQVHWIINSFLPQSGIWHLTLLSI